MYTFAIMVYDNFHWDTFRKLHVCACVMIGLCRPIEIEGKVDDGAAAVKAEV